jgi:hypothetical protein
MLNGGIAAEAGMKKAGSFVKLQRRDFSASYNDYCGYFSSNPGQCQLLQGNYFPGTNDL